MQLKTIQVSGNDALTFLQGFLTCDTRTLSDGRPVLSACCNQKGRMIANFWIWQSNDAVFLQLPQNMVETLTNHLKKYVFRAKVVFSESNEQPILDSIDPPIWILPRLSEQLTPQMIELEKTGGVSFNKGCYLGQEIIVRTEHLGKLKRHLQKATVDSCKTIQVGDDITNARNEKIGIVVAINETLNEIAIVLEDRALNDELTCQNQTITL